MTQQFDLTPEDIVQAHNSPGGDAWIRAQGYGDALDEYLASIEQGETWNPNDMSNVPPTPRASKLDATGQRHTVSVADVPDGEELPPYTEWSHEDLVAECTARGLPTDGSDEDLAVRLLEDDDANEEVQQQSYVGMRKADLQAELQSRGLPDEGNKDVLIARLREHDATQGE